MGTITPAAPTWSEYLICQSAPAEGTCTSALGARAPSASMTLHKLRRAGHETRESVLTVKGHRHEVRARAACASTRRKRARLDSNGSKSRQLPSARPLRLAVRAPPRR